MCKLIEHNNLTNIAGSTGQGYHRDFKVTITEKLQKVVLVEATSRDEAEQIVSDQWGNIEHVLSSDNFTDVEFEAVLAEGQDE